MKNFKQYISEQQLIGKGTHHDVFDHGDYVIKKPKSPDVWFKDGKPTIVYKKLQIMNQHPELFADVKELTKEHVVIKKLRESDEFTDILWHMQQILDEVETHDSDYISDWVTDTLIMGNISTDQKEWAMDFIEMWFEDDDAPEMTHSYQMVINKLNDLHKRYEPLEKKYKPMGIEFDIHMGNMGFEGQWSDGPIMLFDF